MARFDVACPECASVSTFDGHLPFREECEKCSADLHVCLTCRFYDKYASDECRETTADPVARKDRRNLCEYWKPVVTDGDAALSDADIAKAKLAALFGQNPNAPSAVSPGDDGPGSAAPSEADAARAKLDALFKK